MCVESCSVYPAILGNQATTAKANFTKYEWKFFKSELKGPKLLLLWNNKLAYGTVLLGWELVVRRRYMGRLSEST